MIALTNAERQRRYVEKLKAESVFGLDDMGWEAHDGYLLGSKKCLGKGEPMAYYGVRIADIQKWNVDDYKWEIWLDKQRPKGSTSRKMLETGYAKTLLAAIFDVARRLKKIEEEKS